MSKHSIAQSSGHTKKTSPRSALRKKCSTHLQNLNLRVLKGVRIEGDTLGGGSSIWNVNT